MWKWILICRLPIRTNFLLKYTPMMTVREKRSFYQVRLDNIKVIDKRGCPLFYRPGQVVDSLTQFLASFMEFHKLSLISNWYSQDKRYILLTKF